MKFKKIIFNCLVLLSLSAFLGCKITVEQFYTICYQTEKGVAPEAKKVVSGYVLTAEDLPTLTDDNYNFTGWDKTVGTVINADTTITANWAIKQVNITYFTAHGTAPAVKTVNKGYTLTAEDLPILLDDNYNFTGWDKSVGTVIYADTTISATWTIKQVRITYSTAHGTAPVAKTVNKGYTLTAEDLPTLTDTYYNFTGWNKTVGTVINADTTITANWAIKQVNITYSTAHGTAPDTITVAAGYKLKKEDLPFLGKDTTSGKLFAAWNKNAGDEITQDTTITAHWQDEVYFSLNIIKSKIYDNGNHPEVFSQCKRIKFQKERYESDNIDKQYDFTDPTSGKTNFYTGYITYEEELIISGNGNYIIFASYTGQYDDSNNETVESISFKDCVTNYCTDMHLMFKNCSALETVDLSNFNTENVISMGSLFECCSSLKTIYVSDNFTTTKVEDNCNHMFYNCTSLVGGKGTTYAGPNFEGITYAHIDGGTSNPGYFTLKE